MKKFGFWLIFGLILICSGCSNRYFLVNSSGIMEYDRNSGRWSVLWEYNQKEVTKDTIKVIVGDSTVYSKISE